MKVKEIQVADSSYPLSFGSAALAAFLDSVGATLQDLQTGDFGKNLTYRDTLELVYYALKDGHRRTGKEFSLNFEQVCDLVDDSDNELLNAAMDVFQVSVQGQEPGNRKGAKAPRN